MSADPDRRLIDGLSARKPRRLLVASDFHLCSGRDPATGAWLATENFLADDAFAEWIEYCLVEDDEPDTVLVLNGDTFDFVRISETPVTDADFQSWSDQLEALSAKRSPSWLRGTVRGSEPRLGLRTHDFKSVWKLLRIMEGHPRFFAALERWVRAGREVLIVAGNHDPELHWPLVRSAIRTRVGCAEAKPRRVLFCDGSVRFDNVHLEHGHQYDAMTRVKGAPTLRRDDAQLNLPLASFLGRYLINGVEALDPFIDNVKPVQASLLRVVRQRPLRALLKYPDAWRFVGRALVKGRLNRSVLLIALVLLLPFLLLPLYAPPAVRDQVLAWLPVGDQLRFVAGFAISVGLAQLLPYLIGAFNDMRRRRPKPDPLLAPAEEIASTTLSDCRRERAYVCMGHTHVLASKAIPHTDGWQYFNTGTWTALWPADRPDLLGRTMLTYGCFQHDGGGYEAEMLEWDPHARRPRPATILEREHDWRVAVTKESPT